MTYKEKLEELRQELIKQNNYINSLTEWNSYAEYQQSEYDWLLKRYNALKECVTKENENKEYIL